MKTYIKTCKNCGHECHCKSVECSECINDVCVTCVCGEKNASEKGKIPKNNFK